VAVKRQLRPQPKHFAWVFVVGGWTTAALGIAMLSSPAALIFAGMGVVALGLLAVDVGGRK